VIVKKRVKIFRTLCPIWIVILFFVDLSTDCKVMQSGVLFENV